MFVEKTITYVQNKMLTIREHRAGAKMTVRRQFPKRH
jgi:hypothetical protein